MRAFLGSQWLQKLKHQHFNYFIVIIVLLILIIRVVHISADTPILQLFTDEGFKTFDARNKVLFGCWEVAPHPPCYLHLHPVFTLIHYLFFSLFGVGYIQARLVSIILSLLTIILLIRLIKSHYGNGCAIMVGLFAGFNHYFIMISRTAVIEIPVIFFMVLSLYLFDKGSDKLIYYFLSGISVVIAIFTKLYAVFLFPAIILCLIIRKQRKETVYFLCGIIIAIIIYLILWILYTDKETLLNVSRLNFNIIQLEIFRSQDTPLLTSTSLMHTEYIGLKFIFKFLKSVSGRIIYINHIVIMFPTLFLLTGWYFLLWSNKQFKHKISAIELISIYWLVLGTGLLLIAKYASVHHLIILFPPIVMLSTIAIKYFSKNRLINNNILSKIITFMVIHQIIFSLIGLCFKRFIEKTPIINPEANFNIFMFLWFVIRSHSYQSIQLLPRVNAFEFWRVIAILIGIFITVILYNVFSRHRIKSQYVGIICIILFVIINLGRYTYWISFPEYTQKNTSRQLGELVTESDLVIGGQFLCLENRVHFTHHHEPSDKYLSKATHLFKLIYHPLEGFQVNNDVPNRIQHYKFVKRFTICDHIYNLYKLTE